MLKFTKAKFDERFPNDDACLEAIKQARWPNGVTCDACQKVTKHYRIRARKVYGCEFCGNQISPTADTIFHKSVTPLRSWFYAMFLMASTRTGISAKQLERELGVTYKCAWRIFSQIRKLMADSDPYFFGEIEADETYIGGKRPGPRGRGANGKTPVFGLVNRSNRQAVAKVITNVRTKTLMPYITKHVAPSSPVFTDELRSYRRLTLMGYRHETIQHSAKEYVRGEVHVNNVENLWSNLKRGFDGVHHSVSPQHLQSYLDSYVFRYNHRADTQPMFTTLWNQIPLVVS